MIPITYREFEEKVIELGAYVSHRADIVEVYFQEYTVGNISKQEKFQLKADFGYVDEFENAEMTDILILMVRLSATEISDRMTRFKFKIPNSHESHDTLSWLNVHREKKGVAISSDIETILWQTTFTEEDIQSLPEEVRIFLEAMEVHMVD